ncbi:MAG: hypothetical protein M1839_001247 [Geoglossum umbratile]|nr:MAG: hypothetical protein M1839_001247 [Geoglossum umbratile]
MNYIRSFFPRKPKRLSSSGAAKLPQTSSSQVFDPFSFPPPRSTQTVLSLGDTGPSSAFPNTLECDTIEDCQPPGRRPSSLSKSPTWPAYSQTSYSDYVASLRSRIGGHEHVNPPPIDTSSSRYGAEPPIELPGDPHSSPTGESQASPTGQPQAISTTRPSLPLAGPWAKPKYRVGSPVVRRSGRVPAQSFYDIPATGESDREDVQPVPLDDSPFYEHGISITQPGFYSDSAGGEPQSTRLSVADRRPKRKPVKDFHNVPTAGESDRENIQQLPLDDPPPYEYESQAGPSNWYDRDTNTSTQACMICARTLSISTARPSRQTTMPNSDGLSTLLCPGCLENSINLEKILDRTSSTGQVTLETTQCTTCRKSLDSAFYPRLPITRDCSHASEVCLLCVESAVALSVEAPFVDEIYCPHPTCAQQLSQEDVKRVTSSGTFERFADATRSDRERQCRRCHNVLIGYEFPDGNVTAECAHRPNVCISCIENIIVQTLDEDLLEIISCPECGKPMTNDDIWRFSRQSTFERYEKIVKLNRDIECVVCAETLKGRDFPDSCITGTCEHEAMTCRDCIAQHIRMQLDTRTWGQLSCPECPAPMVYADVKRFATAEIFRRYDGLAMRDGIAADAQFRWCPAPNCESGQIHNEGADAPIITCIACGARSCFTHQRLWHDGLTCEEVETGVSPTSRARRLTPQERADQRMAARLQQEEEESNRAAAAQLQRVRDRAATQERARQAEEDRKAREARELLARQRAEEQASEREIRGISKKCPGKRCTWRIQKNDGCDHMTCRPTPLSTRKTSNN